jgi:ATP-dependent Clp protease ATP-binding subunit ClpC
MFERFTEKARRVIFFARYEASEFGSPAIDTEHLLLGILRESQPLGRNILFRLHEVRDQIRAQVPRHEKEMPTNIDLPFSDASKAALGRAVQKAKERQHNTITPELILLALLEDGECLATRILQQTGVDIAAVRDELEAPPGEAEEVTVTKQQVGFGWVRSLRLSEEIKEVLKHAMEEAAQLGHKSAGSEHLLLALLRNEGSPAAKLLRDSGVDLKQMRDKLKQK